MKTETKSDVAYKTIGEVAKQLNLVDKKTGTLKTHTLRYWETQFKQIRPDVRAGKRRYYSKKHFEIIKLIKFLLKEKGFTIYGVKKILNSIETESLDENINLGLYKQNFETTNVVLNRIKKISKIIRELKDFK